MTPFVQKSAFAVANTTAIFAALFIAFSLNLERPYWAMFTVFIIAQPTSGAVRAKAIYRLGGTAAGAAVAVLLIPPLTQAPVLLCLALCVWIGFCVFVSLLDRTPRSYAFLLAGYTAAIVGFSVINAPGGVFDIAISRVEEISLGIICGSVAHSVVFPQNIGALLNDKIDAMLARCSRWIADALAGAGLPEGAEAQQVFSESVTELHLLYTYVAFETSDTPRATRRMRALQDRLSVLLPRLSSLRAAAHALQGEGALPASLAAALRQASAWARDGHEWDSLVSLTLRVGLEGLSHTYADAPPSWRAVLEQTLARDLAALVEALDDCRALASLLRDPRKAIAPHLQAQVRGASRHPLHRDRALALLSAAAAALATGLACVLWIQSAWPEGAIAAQFAAIGCSLFATFDNPVKLLNAAIVGILVALPIGALYQFAILPQIDGFVLLMLVLAPLLLVFSFMQVVEKLEGAALVLAVTFAGALTLQGTYQPDFAGFMNGNMAEIGGILVAVATNLVFRTIDPAWNGIRISKAGWRAVARLARSPVADEHGWTSQMVDRLGLAAARLKTRPAAWAAQNGIDGLRDLRIGLNISALKTAEAEGGPELRDAAGAVLAQVAAYYEARTQTAITSQPIFQPLIDRCLAILHRQILPAGKAAGVSALVGLRLDLAPAAAPYVYLGDAG